MRVRRKTCVISVGKVKIGGHNPIVVQAMAKTKPNRLCQLIKEINALNEAGAKIVRLAIPDEASARAIREIKKEVKVPLIADIHFQAHLAELSAANGVDGLRLNPGNIRRESDWERLAPLCRDRDIPIRVGVNSGSVAREYRKKYPVARAMVENALHYIRVLEKKSFYKIKISLKSSSLWETVEAYRLMAGKTSYPFHLGITASGPLEPGLIKSSMGIGILLAEGLGDTIRVSLTAAAVKEVEAAYEILSFLGLNSRGPELISCPTCGRCQVNLRKIVKTVEKKLKLINKPVKIAIMGCPVNGPGEARGADIGLACGKGKAVLFKHGRVIRSVSQDRMVSTLFKEIEGESR